MNEGVNSLTILKRVILIAVVIIITAFSLYAMNSCSAITGGSKNISKHIGEIYYSENLDYRLKIESKDKALFDNPKREIKLEIEQKDNVLFSSFEEEKFTFVMLSGDRVLYHQKNIIMFNENYFATEESL